MPLPRRLEVTRERFDSGVRRFPIFLALLKMRLLGEYFTALLYPNAISNVVAKHDVEPRQQNARQEI